MKKFFSLFALTSLVFAFGCQHGTKNNSATNGDILIKGVTVGGQSCTENATIEVDGTETEVVVTFAESYAGLSVKIAEKPATINGNEAKLKLDDITETVKAIKIEAKATGRTDKTFNFSVKKKHVEPKNIEISNVTVGGQSCTENATIEVDGTEAEVVVTFAESYAGLSVKIAEKPATINGNEAKLKLDDITETVKAIKIEAKATGRTDKTFNFSVKSKLPVAGIAKLIFEGKEINPTATGYGAKDKKTYSISDAPLLSEIASDGSTKVGEVREPKISVKIKYNEGAKGQKIKVENITTANSSENTKTTAWEKSIASGVGLKLGDNNVIITYYEEGKSPLVYKVIVGYGNPDYAPISTIKINDEWYNAKAKFEALEAGNEVLSVDGVPTADVKITMPEVWYDEQGWKLTLDGQNIEKTEFKKSGYGVITYSMEKKVDLIKDGSKELKIVFENTLYSYNKTYKVTITHITINKIESLISIDAKNKEHVDTNNKLSFTFDVNKKYYKAKNKVIFKDRIEKGTFLVTPQDTTIVPKYVFSNTEVDVSTISTWQAITKKEITYTDYQPTTVNTYLIEDHDLKYEGEFLYVLLESGTVKTYYVTEIKREKIANDNAEKEREEKIYKKENGDKAGEMSPIAKKGLIRVLPKSPRAKVKLTAPTEEDFTLNASDGYYECTIDLSTRETPFSYKIVAEDNTTETSFQGTFVKSLVIKDKGFRFDYEATGSSWLRGYVHEVNGKYYLAFDKNKVKENKLYLFINTYKGLDIACTDFIDPKKTDNYSETDYTITLNIASLVDGTDKNKEYTANLTLEGEVLPQLNLIVFPQDEIVKNIYIGGRKCEQLPDNKYLYKADINAKPIDIAVDLYFLKDETSENTDRKIKILNGTEEKTVTINKKWTEELEFVHEKLTIQDKQTITLTIEYYAKKDDASPTKTYTLEIVDI